MTYSTSRTDFAIKYCFNCGNENEAGAKFCGSCGCVAAFGGNQQGLSRVATPTPTLIQTPQAADPLPQRPPAIQNRQVPVFAHIQSKAAPLVNKELQEEIGKIIVLLARERLFLYMHWGNFLFLNSLGFWLSIKCYYEFIGDEVSKLMIASTPFLFINLVALVCLAPIKGTRKEIARLKERLSYVRFKIEFGHLM